jgi:hypothetical protein
MYFFKLFPKHIWTNNSISRVQFFGNRTRSWQNHFRFVILRNFYLKQKMCVLLKYLLHSLIVPGGGTSETLFEGMTLDFLRNVIRSNDQSQTFSLKQKCLYSKKNNFDTIGWKYFRVFPSMYLEKFSVNSLKRLVFHCKPL